MSMSIDTLPRPARSGLRLGAEYWLTPDAMFAHLDGLPERFVVDLPGLPTWVCTTNPDDVKKIFTSGAASLQMGEALRRLAAHEPLVGADALIFKDGPAHISERRSLAPAFHGDRLAAYEASMVAITERRLAEWPTDVPVRFDKLMQQLTLDIIMDVVFGVSDAARLDRLRGAVLDLDRVAGSRFFLGQMFVALLLRGRWAFVSPAVRRAVEQLDAVVIDEIASRRRDGVERTDFLTSFLEIRDERGDPMPDRQIAQVLRGLLLGGHDTTSLTLTWLAERLVRNPGALERLEAAVGAGDDGYVDATVAETLRLRPIAPFTGRWVMKPFELGNVTVPPGVVVVPFITLLHRRPDIYPDPLAFKPERFLGTRPGTYTWIPFGGGAHRCLGGAFALTEMRAIVRTIMRRRRFSAVDAPDEPAMRRHFAVAPSLGGTVTLRRTANAA